jgi:2-polyprenyl-3-methyl-5-hydroxy-6-metoxy-1,4-benzoquinol methylase
LKNSKLKLIEKETLATFKKEMPGRYFSHLYGKDKFISHDNKINNLYRFGLNFPPEFFSGKKIIDLGAGTGENTVSLARWGGVITLVEINSNALKIAKTVFSKYTKNFNRHKFINSSLYDIDLKSLREKFDISHSRGVFTHVYNKFKAFKILASLAKPGGYIIYGDRNVFGGLQEMLQRFAIYFLINKSNDKLDNFEKKKFYN